jgi:hypothetical protein
MLTQRCLIAILFPLLLVVGCAPERPLPPGSTSKCVSLIPAGKGRIWIYRTAPRSIGELPHVVVDGRLFEALRPRIGYTIDLPPGVHSVQLAYFQEKLDVTVKSATEYFVRFDVDPATFGKGFYPVLVDGDTARGELRLHAEIDFNCVREN